MIPAQSSNRKPILPVQHFHEQPQTSMAGLLWALGAKVAISIAVRTSSITGDSKMLSRMTFYLIREIS